MATAYIVKRKLQSAVGGGGDGEVIEGAPGAAGIQGITGVGGIPGVPGVAGLTGATGAAGLSVLIQHIQTNTTSDISSQDTIVVNHLVVRKTCKIPALTDGFK